MPACLSFYFSLGLSQAYREAAVSLGRCSELDCLDWAVLHALHAEDAFGPIEAVSAVVSDVHIHRTHLFAHSAGDTPLSVHPHPQQGIPAGGLQEHRDRTDVFAEGPVIPQGNGQPDPHSIVQGIADKKAPEQDRLLVGDPQNKQRPHEQQRQRKHDIADKAPVFLGDAGRL